VVTSDSRIRWKPELVQHGIRQGTGKPGQIAYEGATAANTSDLQGECKLVGGPSLPADERQIAAVELEGRKAELGGAGRIAVVEALRVKRGRGRREHTLLLRPVDPRMWVDSADRPRLYWGLSG
jgi:hypothetical protein